MTDLEMIKKCAEKMVEAHVYRDVGFYDPDTPSIVYSDGTGGDYDPLHDDAQAMALVKKLRLSIDTYEVGQWRVYTEELATLHGTMFCADGDDLNRAIVECVAKLDN